MENIKITNNEGLKLFVSKIDANKDLFAIRTRHKIEVFKTKRAFNKVAKTLPNAVQGLLTYNNYSLYKFANLAK